MKEFILPSTDPLELTSQLISIPSYVDNNHDETKLIDFLLLFFKTHLPFLTVEKQYIDDKNERANLVITGKSESSILFLGHIDTVQPSNNWLTDPLQPTIIGDRLYGLGAADMKGSLSSFLCALTKARPEALNNIMVLLYVDEEYNFLGTKHFVKHANFSKNAPQLIISLDGSPELASGCRGLIEFDAKITGQSGHASNPANGNNVIMSVSRAVHALSEVIKAYDDEYLGESSLNLAYLQGGITEKKELDVIWLREGNVIPDTADITLEVRTANAALDSEELISLFNQQIARQNLKLTSLSIKHDFKPWGVSYDSPVIDIFTNLYKEAGIEFSLSDRKYSGFIDVQLVTEKVSSPAFVLGAGGENKHGSNENVKIENLTKIQDLYLIVLHKFGDLDNDQSISI